MSKRISTEWLEVIGGGMACLVLSILAFAILIYGNNEKALPECIEMPLEEISEAFPEEASASEPQSIVSHVHLTCYQPVKEQCNNDPLHTADGSKIDLDKLKSGSIKWVAISRDLECLFPMGSKVKITDERTGKEYGVYVVKDRMNKRWKHRMDILIHPESKERFSEPNIKVELV